MAFDIPKPDPRRPRGKSLLAAARGKTQDRSEATYLRDYAPGDDYRQIDWTWCARRDEILTKVRPPHREESLFLLLDASRSMAAAEAKMELVRRIAAILGADALRHEQLVSAAAFSNRVQSLFPLRWGTAGIAPFMRFLTTLELRGDGTDLAAAADDLAQSTRRRGAVVLMSDLLDRHGFAEGIDRLRHHGFEPLVIQPIVAADADAPCLGEVELVDVETGRSQKVVVTEKAAAEYRRRVAAFYQSVREHCAKRRIVCLQPLHDAKAEDVVGELALAAASRPPRRNRGVSP